MTGSTVINPAVGVCLQMVAAWAQKDHMVFFRDVWPLLIPSVLGSILGGYFMTKFYEPPLLFIKYEDLAQEPLSDKSDEEESISA